MYEPIRTKPVHRTAGPPADVPRRTREEELDVQLAAHLSALLTVTDELRALAPRDTVLDAAADRLAAQVARLRGGSAPMRGARSAERPASAQRSESAPHSAGTGDLERAGRSGEAESAGRAGHPGRVEHPGDAAAPGSGTGSDQRDLGEQGDLGVQREQGEQEEQDDLGDQPPAARTAALHQRAHTLAGRALVVAASRADTAAAILSAECMDLHAGAVRAAEAAEPRGASAARTALLRDGTPANVAAPL